MQKQFISEKTAKTKFAVLLQILMFVGACLRARVKFSFKLAFGRLNLQTKTLYLLKNFERFSI